MPSAPRGNSPGQTLPKAVKKITKKSDNVASASTSKKQNLSEEQLSNLLNNEEDEIDPDWEKISDKGKHSPFS